MVKNVSTAPGSFRGDELVVDAQHRQLVIKKLADFGVHTESQPDVDDRLGLALISGLVDAAGRPVAELDSVLSELRREFEAGYGGWTPLMGKNRSVGSVTRFPQASSQQASSLSGYPEPMPPGPVAGTDGEGDGGYPEPMEPPPVGPPPFGSGRVSMLAGSFGNGSRKPMKGREPVPVERPGSRNGRHSDAGRSVRVGILDTPLYSHRDLAGRYYADVDSLLAPAPDEVLAFRAGHATMVADLVLARAPAAELDVRSVLDGEHGLANVWETAKKMMSFAEAGVQVLNLSLGCYTTDGKPPLVLERAIERLSPSMLIVAAAGNHGQLTGMVNGLTDRSPTWPAALPDVVAVGAYENGDGEPAEFSPRLPWVELTAPGVDVVGAYLDATVQLSSGPTRFTGYAKWSGTSFAAATVSGAIAAKIVPGQVSAREALNQLLADPNSVVKKYVATS